MRRDYGSELIVAIVAIGIIFFAVLFAIVLSVSNGEQPAVVVPTTALSTVGQTVSST